MKSWSARFSSSHSGHSTSARLARPNVRLLAMPNSSALTATSRSIAKPKVIGWPLARTTRMPSTMRPSVWPLVRAIIAGA